MRWSRVATRFVRKPHNKPVMRRTRRHFAILLGCAFFSFLVFSSAVAGAPEEARMSVYSTLANYSVPVVERNSLTYVGLLELLDPLGTVTANTDGSHWKLRYNAADVEFAAGKTRVKIKSGDFDLPANFLLENGRGLVPISALAGLLPRILGGPVSFREAARRLFIGNTGIHFTAQVVSANPPQLVMNFSSSVAPAIHRENGKLRVVFEHDAIMPPGSSLLTFGNAIIPSATYQEENGAAEISISGTVPLYASLSNEGRTITVGTTEVAAATTPPQAIATPHVTPSRRFLVAIDASHGGTERGAALTDQLAEKDVTLAFAVALRHELEVRGVATLMLRDGDATLSADQRASVANAARPALYVCLHAAEPGGPVRLYTALLPPATNNHGPFLDWNAAQAPYLSASRAEANRIAFELRKDQIAVRTLPADLRPLNNITTAAMAVEVTPPHNVNELLSPTYQRAVAASLADGIVAIRTGEEAAK
jgi:N-acetylmuramoyl-L-alanine amidase